MPKNLMYCECGEPATWVRHTQFAGDHYFCTTHAKEEEDFGKLNSSYFFWEEISGDQISKKKHPVEVIGYSGSFQELSEAILRMRYDKVDEFFQCCVTELRRQAEGDRKRGRGNLATRLDEAASTARQQQEQFSKIFILCKPHMSDELE